MLKTKEFQPHTLKMWVTVDRYTCPICGESYEYVQGHLPERCAKCDTSFEWIVKAHYQEQEEGRVE